MAKLPSIPSISSLVPREISALLRPMREILTAFTSGDGQVATLGQLRRAGMITGFNADGSFQASDVYDTTPPPAPTGLTAGGALANIMLSWDATTYSNLAYTEVWRAQTNDFSLAQLIGRGDGRVYVDNVGGAATRYYWIRYISRANIPGLFNAQLGTPGQTGADAAYLLSLLSNQITETQLYATLGARINLIDTPGTGLVAKVAAETSTRTTQTGELYAQYTVKVDVNGYVSGYGLASTLKDAVASSAFAVRSDTFYIANPAGPGVAPALPFIVRTTVTTINGVSVPVGVYVQDAFIANGTITNAKIGNAAIDDAKIASLDAAKITTGYIDAARINVGSLDAKIANLGAAVISSGFINAARINTASIANATISTAQIASATINNAQINGDIYSTNWVYGVSGWYLSRTGALYANSGEFRGQLVAASGTFAGSLSAATGTFAGTLTAAAINAVNTINIGADQVTIPVSNNGGAINLPSQNVEVAAVAVGIASSGGPIFITWAVSPSSALYGVGTVLYRNGVQIAAFRTFGGCFKDQPGVGSYTYQVNAYIGMSGVTNVACSNSTIMCLEAKR